MFFVLVFLDGQYRVINVSLEYINDIDFKMKLFKYLIASFVIYQLSVCSCRSKVMTPYMELVGVKSIWQLDIRC